MENDLRLIKGGKIHLPESLRVYGNNLLNRLEQGFPNLNLIGKHSVGWYKGKYIPVIDTEYRIKEGEGPTGRIFGKDLIKMSMLKFEFESEKVHITIYDGSLEDCVRDSVRDFDEKSGLKSHIKLSSYKPNLFNPLDEDGLIKIPYIAVTGGALILTCILKNYF